MSDHLLDLERHYVAGLERHRLVDDEGGPRLELVRSLELLGRFLPPAPADVLDVGGGPGTYAAPLAADGYRVVLIDVLPAHVAERAAIERDLQDGQHRTPDPDRPEWFTTAFFHHPDELRDEVAEAGFDVEAVLGIEGPAWLVEHQWADRDRRQRLLFAARAVEAEPSLLGGSSHILAAGLK